MPSRLRAGWEVPAAIIAAVAGMAIAVYLSITHVSTVPLVCTIGSVVNCVSVTHSAYSVIPGTSIPISMPGVAWFVISAALVLTGPRWAHFAWAAIGLAVVLYLVYIEIVVLHQICEWCTVVHLLVLATFVLALLRLQRTLGSVESGEEG